MSDVAFRRAHRWELARCARLAGESESRAYRRGRAGNAGVKATHQWARASLAALGAVALTAGHRTWISERRDVAVGARPIDRRTTARWFLAALAYGLSLALLLVAATGEHRPVWVTAIAVFEVLVMCGAVVWARWGSSGARHQRHGKALRGVPAVREVYLVANLAGEPGPLGMARAAKGFLGLADRHGWGLVAETADPMRCRQYRRLYGFELVEEFGKDRVLLVRRPAAPARSGAVAP